VACERSYHESCQWERIAAAELPHSKCIKRESGWGPPGVLRKYSF
jgi:hypothetical protein